MISKLNKELKPKHYLFALFAILCLYFTISFMISVVVDDYGIFKKHEKRRYWENAKVSKYMLSHRYIPENYDGLIIGPSYSANLNPNDIDAYKIYNLSMNGANISELSVCYDIIVERGNIDFIILCVTPYLTQDSGLKGNEMDRYTYWRKLFFPKVALKSVPARWGYKKNKIDTKANSEHGFDDFNLKHKNINFDQEIEKRKNAIFTVNDKALEEMNLLLKDCRKRKIKVFAYYYPYYSDILKAKIDDGTWQSYKAKMDSLFTDADTVWDMNNNTTFTNDKTNYSDGHLSNKGAKSVAHDILSKLNSTK